MKKYFALGPQEQDESVGELIFIPKADILTGLCVTENGNGCNKFTPALAACCYVYRKVFEESRLV